MQATACTAPDPESSWTEGERVMTKEVGKFDALEFADVNAIYAARAAGGTLLAWEADYRLPGCIAGSLLDALISRRALTGTVEKCS